MSTERGVDKDVVCGCACNEYYSAIKERMLFAKIWMELEGIILSERSETEKDKCCIIHLYVESKNNTNEQTTE